MQSDFPESNYYTYFDSSQERLELKVNQLMPRLAPAWKHLLLNDNKSQMTGLEVAQTILRERGRMDVKVCASNNELNCYSFLFNLVGLSEDIAGSPSVIAAAIAAHEVGHALQPMFEEKLRRTLMDSPLIRLPVLLADLLMLILMLSKEIGLGNLGFSLEIIQSQNQDCSQNYRLYRLPLQNLEYSRLIRRRHLLPLAITLFKWVWRHLLHLAIMLFKVTAMLLQWVLGLCFFLISFTFFLGFLVLFTPPFICCVLIFRSLVFIFELRASSLALRLLKQYKILDIKQQKAARKFLWSCALTYLHL